MVSLNCTDSVQKIEEQFFILKFFRTWAPFAAWTLIVLNKLSQEENFRKNRVQMDETYLHLKIFLFRYNFSSLQNKKVIICHLQSCNNISCYSFDGIRFLKLKWNFTQTHHVATPESFQSDLSVLQRNGHVYCWVSVRLSILYPTS